MTGAWLLSYLILWLVVIAEGLLILALYSTVGRAEEEKKPPERLAVGDELPIELLGRLDGQFVPLSELRTNGLTLIFATTTCKRCTTLFDELAERWNETTRPSPNASILCVGEPQNVRAALGEFIRFHWLTIVPIGADDSLDIGGMLGIGMTSAFVLLSPQGRIQEIESGPNVSNRLLELYPARPMPARQADLREGVA